MLTNDQRSEVEHLLIEYADIFAKHRCNVRYNSDLKIKLTPEHQRPLYTQGPPTPIQLRNELTVELALMHYFDSKYSSPLFAHRKPPGKLRLFIDLRRINHSIKTDYIISNFPNVKHDRCFEPLCRKEFVYQIGRLTSIPLCENGR